MQSFIKRISSIYRRLPRYNDIKFCHPGFPLKPIPMGDGFSLMETENPNKGFFANRRQKLSNKYISKFPNIKLIFLTFLRVQEMRFLREIS